jgi:hypothetical protein
MPTSPIAAIQDRLSSILFDFKDASEILQEEEAYLGRRSGQALYRALVALEQAREAFLRTCERSLAYCAAWQGLVRSLRALAESLSRGDLIPLAFRIEHEEPVVAQLQTGSACTSTAESIERAANRVRNRLRALRSELDTTVVHDSLMPRKAHYRRARENYLKQLDEVSLEAWRDASIDLQSEAVRAVQRFSDAVDEVVGLIARSGYHIGAMLTDEWREAAAATTGLEDILLQAPSLAIRDLDEPTRATASATTAASGYDSRETDRPQEKTGATPSSSRPIGTVINASEEESGAAFALYDELDAAYDTCTRDEDQNNEASVLESAQTPAVSEGRPK